MSWFARSIANSLRLDPDGDSDEDDRDRDRSQPPSAPPASTEGDDGEEEDASQTQGRGVKEDLSELTQTLTRQLWGVASFLAPPPQSRPDTAASPDSPPRISTSPKVSSQSGQESVSYRSDLADEAVDSPRIARIRSDFAEIGGRFRSGISRLSSNKAVSEISKIASTFLPFGAEDDVEEERDDEEGYGSGGGAVGVTEEVLAFARNISMHPETWLDFPLLPEEDESDDFDMSDAQQEHALAVEHLAPRLAALRIELCPSHMSEGCFWKIYFVLLHPRLNKEDAERLSTPQIVEARAMLLQELQNRTKAESDMLRRSTSYRKESASSTPSGEQHFATPSGAFHDSSLLKARAFEESIPSMTTSGFETEKHPVIMTEIKIVDKSVTEEQLNQAKNLTSDPSKVPVDRYEDDGDDWLQEDDDDTTQTGVSRVTSIPIGNDEDVSFSDLEDEDDRSAPTSSKTTTQTFSSRTSTKESADWVQLHKNSSKPAKDGKSGSTDSKESSEWLDVEDIDAV